MIQVKVATEKKTGKISPAIYGQMVEHAYWSVHLGLCAQMLDNGGFELDREHFHTKIAQAWKIISTDYQNEWVSRVDDESPYNGGYCQKITVKKYHGGVVRLQQNCLSVEKGKSYRGFIMLKGSSGRAAIKLLTVSQQVIGEKIVETGGEWAKYEFSFTSTVTDFSAIFAVEIQSPGVLFADQAFFYPADSYGGTRKDIVQLYKDLNPPFVRWPGGSYLMWHRWKEGIGPLEDRPYNDGRILRDRNFGIYHDGEWDSNAFGTDEFVQFCRDINTEPMINVNIKDGLQNTLDWIEYCNGDVSTTWGAERSKNGHGEPYKVKYWVIDNEPLVHVGDKGFCEETFPIDTAVWAKAMKEKDPSLVIMCMGVHDIYNYIFTEPEFCETVVKAAKDNLDHLCVHIYYDQTATGPLQGLPYKMGESFTRLKTMINRHITSRDAKVFLSEWNPESNTNIGGNMGQALEGAQLFHVMERASAAGVMDFACPCQLCVNVDKYRGYWLRAALVQINNHDSWTSPLYHVNKMYSCYRQPNLLETDFNNREKRGSTIFNGYEFPAVDLIAAGSDDGKTVVIKIVNNSDSDEYEFDFVLKEFVIGSAEAHVVSAGDILDINSQFAKDHITEQVSALRAEGDSLRYTARPNAVSLLEIKTKQG
jgi:alpha-N-arabinofuranosidase